MKEAGCGRKCEGWFENGRCTLPIKVECWLIQDCCLVEVGMAIIICREYYQILDIGVCLMAEVQKLIAK